MNEEWIKDSSLLGPGFSIITVKREVPLQGSITPVYKKYQFFVFVSNKFCVFQSMSLRYHPCLLCGQEVDPAYQKKLASYRPILPKIVLEVTPGEPVDPKPVRLQSDSELKEIQRNVEEAIKEARRRHLPEN